MRPPWEKVCRLVRVFVSMSRSKTNTMPPHFPFGFDFDFDVMLPLLRSYFLVLSLVLVVLSTQTSNGERSLPFRVTRSITIDARIMSFLWSLAAETNSSKGRDPDDQNQQTRTRRERDRQERGIVKREVKNSPARSARRH